MENNQAIYNDTLREDRPLIKSYKILISLSFVEIIIYILFHFMPFMQPKEGRIICAFLFLFIFSNLSILIYNIKRFHLLKKSNTYKIENSLDDVLMYKKITKFLLVLNVFFGLLFLVNSVTLFCKETFSQTIDNDINYKKTNKEIADNICYNFQNIISLKTEKNKKYNSFSQFLYLCNFNISSSKLLKQSNKNFIKCQYFPNNINYSNRTVDKNLFLDFINSKKKGKYGKNLRKSLFDFLSFCDKNKINIYFLNSTIEIKNEINSNVSIISENSDIEDQNYFSDFNILFGFVGGIISNLTLIFIFAIKIVILFDEFNRYHLKPRINHIRISNRINFPNRMDGRANRNANNNNYNNDINSVSTEGSENSVSIGDIQMNIENNQNNLFQIIN